MTRTLNRLAAALATFALIGVCGWTAPAFATYALVWSDEFDGPSLNTADWSYDIGTGCPDLCGWGNNELQYYRSQNVAVTGGNLVITTKREYYGGAQFTSGKVHTRGKQSFLYGRVEMRAKLPTGGGIWPAFWMMPQDDAYGVWASSGEIDIMESSNATTTVGGALHYGGTWPDNTSTSSSHSLGGTNFADDFHVYAVEWEPDVMRWYVDDTLFMTRTSSSWWSAGAPGNPQAPFDQPFYIILNAAVGGWYTGCTDPSCVTADLPQEYLIDYVRVYEDIDNLPPTVTLTAPVRGDHPPAGDIVITADAADEDGTVAVVEFYNGTTLLGSDATVPYTCTWTGVADGCYQVVAKAIDDLGGAAIDAQDITVGSGCGQAPFLGSPFALPTRIEAEDYDAGGEGVGYHDADAANQGGQYRPSEGVDIENCADTGGGYGVGWINPGEWLEYTVSIPATMEYTFEARVASLSAGGYFRLEVDGVDVTGSIQVPVTTGWQTWVTVTAPATLPAGTRVMRFVPLTDGFNVNWFEFIGAPAAAGEGLPTAGYALNPAYPNPFNPLTTLSYDLPVASHVRLTVFDVAGKRVRTLVAGERIGAGRHEAVWDGRDDAGRSAPAGVYFYRLDTDGFSQTRRMALVK